MAPIRFMRVSTYVCMYMHLSINTVCNIGALSICRSTKKVSLIQKVKIDLGDFQRFLNNVSRHSFTFCYYHFMCGLCSCVKIFVSIFYSVLRSKYFSHYGNNTLLCSARVNQLFCLYFLRSKFLCCTQKFSLSMCNCMISVAHGKDKTFLKEMQETSNAQFVLLILSPLGHRA